MEANYRVGQYVLERPLGEGGMAEVWLARNVHLGTPAAVKFLNQAYAGVSEIEQRFLNEGRRQGSLNHPNIIKVYGFEYVDNRSFLILQYIDGEPLDNIVHRAGRLDPAEAVRIAISVLNALDYAHDHNIVHRDIKPSNILLDSSGFPYLGDFGIVLATNEKRMTRAGQAMGTALYMSPEQIREPGSVDRRADIYSFGCVLYEMLTGEPPFNPSSTGQGDTDFAVKMAHVQQPPPPLRQRNSSLSPELEAVVMRCLAKNPADRFRTCREARDALGAAMVSRQFAPPPPLQTPAQQRHTPVPPAPPPVWPPAPPVQSTIPPVWPPAPPVHPTIPPVPPPAVAKPRWPVPVAISVGVLLLIIVMIFAFKPHPAPDPPPPNQADLEQQRLKEADRRAQEQKEADRRAQEQKEAARVALEQQQIQQMEAADKEFAAAQERVRLTLNGNYHSISFHNNCAKTDIMVIATYRDLEGDWVTSGWWKVTSMTELNPAIFTQTPTFYFYAFGVTSNLIWNGDGKEGAVDMPVVDNNFSQKTNTPLEGRNKRTVKMFKTVFNAPYGRHNQSFTCGT